MSQFVKLSESAWENIQEHAVEIFPNECCGFLFGNETDEVRYIELAVPVNNSKEGDQREDLRFHH